MWLWKQLGKNSYKNSSVSNIRKGKQIYEVLLACDLASAVFPLLSLVALTQRPTSGWGTARSLSAAESVASIWIQNYFNHIILQNVVSPKENSYSGI